MGQQTALQKAIEEIKNMAGAFEHQRIPAVLLLSKIIPLLEDEKEQIDKAHHDGYYREDLYDTRNYYNDNYGTKKS